MNTQQTMLRLDEALDIIDQTLAGVTLPTQRMPVIEAVGRTLATDQVSRLDLPPFDKSAMDGYAILEGDRRGTYAVLETVAAGGMPHVRLETGASVKVMTGAPVPPGTGQVIQVEHVRLHGKQIEIVEHDRQKNLCRQGEDVRQGDVVLRAGKRLAPVDVANLIGCGITEVDVSRRTRIAVLSTGDEIADDPRELSPGRIMNTNGPLLACLARQHDMEVTVVSSVRDDRAAIAATIAAAVEQSDVIVLSGGVSVGDFDFVTPALQDAGLSVHFSAVALKPGRPTTYASARGKAVFGLPGNPVSVFLMFHLFVLHAAARLTGRSRPSREISMPLSSEFRRQKIDRTEYVPCRVHATGRLERMDFHGSAHLTALSEADGFFIVPQGTATLAPGQSVQFLPLRLF